MRHFPADAGGFSTTMEVAGMTAGMNTRPPVGLLRHTRRARDHEEIPIGATVKTPLGLLAVVESYRGIGTRQGEGRSHRVFLVCRYVHPANKRYDIVQILPENVTVVEAGSELGNVRWQCS